jgi:hypothetical protein
MEYQEYPDIQTIEKIAWKEMAGIFSTIVKKNGFLRIIIFTVPFLFFVNLLGASMLDKRQRMSDTEKDDGHFLPDDGRFFPDDGHFFCDVGQIFFHVGQKISNDGHFFENVGQSHAVLDVFSQMLDDPVIMLDSQPGKADGMLNEFLQMLNKKDPFLNIWQKMSNIVLWMWNDPEMKNRKISNIPVRESMNIEM